MILQTYIFDDTVSRMELSKYIYKNFMILIDNIPMSSAALERTRSRSVVEIYNIQTFNTESINCL